MPELPAGCYERVVIHDNFDAIYRFAEKRQRSRAAISGLVGFNGRFIAVPWQAPNGREVTLIATGMGSAATNHLVECLGRLEYHCQGVIKVGTFSALQETLNEGDILIPDGALIDEGATAWRQVKKDHEEGRFSSDGHVQRYIESRRCVTSNAQLNSLLESAIIRKGLSKPGRGYVWSVDAYDCFDGSHDLYSRVDQKQFDVPGWNGNGSKNLSLSGVEMECSALFSSAESLRVRAAALVVVSRTRARLLGTPVESRRVREIHAAEDQCLDAAIDVSSEMVLATTSA